MNFIVEFDIKGPNENCPDDKVVTTMDECMQAIEKFGFELLVLQANDSNIPAGCSTMPKKGNWLVVFNQITDPSETNPQFFLARPICRKIAQGMCFTNSYAVLDNIP